MAVNKKQTALKEKKTAEQIKISIEETEKFKDKFQYIPLGMGVLLLALAVLCIIEAATHNGDGYIWFLDYGGVFRFNHIRIGNLTLYWFFVLTGLFFTFLSSFIRGYRYRMHNWSAFSMPLFFFVESLMGAKVLFAFEKAIENGTLKNLDFSGQSLFGSLYLTLPLIPVLAVIFKRKTRELYDFVAPFWLILLAFTRMGCFSWGCCGSKEYLLNGNPILYPVQLFDSICSLLLLFLCLRSESREDRRLFGIVLRPFPILLAGYGVCRFMLEFIRTNVALFYRLTISQYHCILFVVIGVIMILFDNGILCRKPKKKHQ